MVTIEASGWSDFEELELPRQPDEGEPVETKYGTCFVTHAEPTPDMDRFDVKITCRLG